MKAVKVSAASARLRFHGCEPTYISTRCHAACCRSSSAPNGILVTIHASEQAAIQALGAHVAGGFVQPRRGEKHCPFEMPAHLCMLHGTDKKPFGCIASPFTLNHRGTLIVRNRYKLLRCYRDGQHQPAYIAFRASFDRLFGFEEAYRICQHLENGGGDIMAAMPDDTYQMLVDNDDAKRHG